MDTVHAAQAVPDCPCVCVKPADNCQCCAIERVFSVSRSTVYRKVRKYGTTPHGARKTFARALFDRTGDLARVQKAMNHSNLQLTGYYAFSNNDLT